MKKAILLSIIILLCAAIPVETLHANETLHATSLRQFVRNIQVFNRLVPQEKVYLHFDNTGYVLGDTIWFKAYVVNASDFMPDTLSGVLYVELLNEKGKLLETKKLKIENGHCHGEFGLDDTDVEYFAGFYEVRAYTKFMLNFGEETVFSRVFPVFNDFRENGQYTERDIKADLRINEDVNLEIPLPNLRPKEEKANKMNMDFYPEGGKLVTGLTSRVAFRITDGKGRPLDAAGNVIDSQGEILSVFSTLHAGMGYFSYTPDGKPNRVKINHNNREYIFDLPESKPDGYVLQALHSSDNALIMQIEKTPQTPKSLLGLSVLCRGEVLFFGEIDFEDNLYVSKIPYDELETGVHQITLFDSKGEIFAERLVFILPEDEKQLRFEAIANKESYEPEDLIRIDFSLTGSRTDKRASFSLVVRDEETMIRTDRRNICTDLLLSSDLKGFIENPEDYFSSGNPNLQTRRLDLLMMVQGWKRYEWQTMAGVKPFQSVFNLEKQLTIKGYVTSSEGRNIELSAGMINVDNEQRLDGEAKTDDKGEFYILPGDVYGSWSLSLRSRGLSDANKKIRLDRWFSPAPKSYAYFETSWINNDGSWRRSNDDAPVLTEESSANDSTDWAFRIETVNITTKQKKKKTKEFIHHVGREIDRAIDEGKRIPYSVHDYLAERDKQYSFGKTPGMIKGKINEKEIITSPFDVSLRKGSPEDMVEASKYVLPLPAADIDCDGRDIYEETDAGDAQRTIMSFYYGRPLIAKFFHFHEGKPEAYDRTTYQTGKRAYDIRVKELTAKREILDVDKIVISGERVQDCEHELFTPIYIYPYSDYMMRNMPGSRYTTFDGFSVPADYFRDRITDGVYRPAKYTYHRTLYWNPNVTTDEEGKASIRFYNNDFCRKINISAEGITETGMPIVAQ